jgi:hypothetical protein
MNKASYFITVLQKRYFATFKNYQMQSFKYNELNHVMHIAKSKTFRPKINLLEEMFKTNFIFQFIPLYFDAFLNLGSFA